MQWVIDEDIRETLAERGEVFTVELTRICASGGCSCMDIYYPVLRPGLPDQPEYYLTGQAEGFTIHYPRVLQLIDADQPAQVKKAGRWSNGEFDVENVRVL
ncbi:hypothetical protein GTO91_09245 [Heliobacterium undosum]|uniref:FeS cluster biogenesis domain-containing protein n=1 Tax=Heliomicrobium undosum TaxID=121734 RepID=A0A845L2I4_9FIRM|nr:hypothetical protein [Heliomicrobium undosum]MZP29886.1 hypothetical protein [Heliomicrobium undosum]